MPPRNTRTAHPAVSQQVEQMLTARGIDFDFEANVLIAEIRDVEGNGLRCRGERRQLMSAAPGLEVAPVVSVSLECCRGLGCGNELKVIVARAQGSAGVGRRRHSVHIRIVGESGVRNSGNSLSISWSSRNNLSYSASVIVGRSRT